MDNVLEITRSINPLAVSLPLPSVKEGRGVSLNIFILETCLSPIPKRRRVQFLSVENQEVGVR